MVFQAIDGVLDILVNEPDATQAFEQILAHGREQLKSTIWDKYTQMNLNRDLQSATHWFQAEIAKHPTATGIYFGLDTLNMNDGHGRNVELGFSSDCHPEKLEDEWSYRCDQFGSPHLILGLSEVSYTFENEDTWSYKERAFAEYFFFLGYSGIVLREAMKAADFGQDFLAMWGFHDGDMFYLARRNQGEWQTVANLQPSRS
ncbi:hypothetical protein [Pontibacter sp. G13]|uniref:hypothetical protein n=1 Tax=Pontibacter sp. G13 TaxID=3074898 RepID=UPI00288A0AC3|nr:hypothetical protein [Pontibacter sp. G13]WNJ19033.1 hypothetical protein RJD25_00960 [Pontibacter sp. G13]